MLRTFIGLLTGIVMLATSVPSLAAAQPAPTRYENTAEGFSFDVPAGWQRVPDAVVQHVYEVATTPESRKTFRYVAGFQPHPEPWLAYPYVLVQVTPYHASRPPNETEMKKAVAAMSGLDINGQLQQGLSEEAKSLVNSGTSGAASLDTATQTFRYRLKMDVTGLGKVEGVVAGFFGKEALLQIMYYQMAPAKVDAGFESMVRSFAFDATHRYPPDALHVAAGIDWSDKAGLYIGAICGAGIVMILYRRYKRQKAKSA